MDRVSIGLEKAYLGWDASAYLYDESGKKIRSVPNTAGELPAQKVEALWKELRRRKRPFIEREENFCYLVLSAEEQMMVIGPVFVPGYNRKQGVRSMPVLFPKKAAACLSVVCCLVSGEYYPEEELLKPLRTSESGEGGQQEFLQYESLEHSEEDADRYQYDTELEWTSLIERGELDRQVVDMKRTQNELYAVGILTEKGDSKQAEYMMVCAITLASRAAIRGGVDSYKIYQLSDRYLQKLSAAETVWEIMSVGMEAMNVFNDLVKARLQNGSNNIYCEKAKNYIGRHLREKIRIADIACQVGLNSSYLTNVFSKEEGIPLKTYIMREKLELAANLLKNTDQTIGFISDYLSFNSQSYFSSCFRREYGMMPTEYRQKYKIYIDVSNKK